MEGFLYGERGVFVESIQKMRDETVCLKFKWRLTVSFTLTDFQQILFRRMITGEWLYELYQNGSAKCIYEREKSAKPVLDASIKLTSEEQNRFATYADDFEDNTTDLFLTEMNRGKSMQKHQSCRYQKFSDG